MKSQNYNDILAQTISDTDNTMLTIEQKLSRNEAERKRLMTKKNSLETGQKVIIGGMFLSLAKTNTGIAKFILENASTHITRPADIKRIEPLLEELRQAMVSDSGENNSV
ncbi:hypothetical protein ACTXMK_14520 [Psychrobacter celer]|uniref:hypothetical protein n=1 Tax=Psychrobacter celer TaxID=306572 RepID=UPI003FD50040